MNTSIGRARIGQWYRRWDTGEIFQVTGLDEGSGTIEIQNFDGDLDEIESSLWRSLPLAFSEPPEEWTGPPEEVEFDDFGYRANGLSPEERAEALERRR